MKDHIKEIAFTNRKFRHSHFDLVHLEKLLQIAPADHSQFEHHKVTFYVLLIVTEGSGTHSVNYKDFSFKRGSIFALRKGTIHKFYKTKAKGVLLIFTSDFVVRFSDFEGKLRISRLFNEFMGSPKFQLEDASFEEIENLVGEVEKEYLDLNDQQTSEIIRNFVQIIILKLYRKKSKNPINNHYLLKFIRLQELIEKECFEHKKVTYYAKKMSVTSKTLNNITQQVIGKSAKALLDEILIVKIKRLLVQNTNSLSEVAYMAGFSEPTNFFKFFRKKTGLSPKQFRTTMN